MDNKLSFFNIYKIKLEQINQLLIEYPLNEKYSDHNIYNKEISQERCTILQKLESNIKDLEKLNSVKKNNFLPKDSFEIYQFVNLMNMTLSKPIVVIVFNNIVFNNIIKKLILIYENQIINFIFNSINILEKNNYNIVDDKHLKILKEEYNNLIKTVSYVKGWVNEK